jgi:hypothetical protein
MLRFSSVTMFLTKPMRLRERIWPEIGGVMMKKIASRPQAIFARFSKVAGLNEVLLPAENIHALRSNAAASQ